MSIRKEDSSHSETHQRAAVLHDNAAQEHRLAAGHAGKQDLEAGKERSRRALENSRQAYFYTEQVHDRATNKKGITHFGHSDVATLAYELWQGRGWPTGSPETDWFQAMEMLRSGK